MPETVHSLESEASVKLVSREIGRKTLRFGGAQHECFGNTRLVWTIETAIYGIQKTLGIQKEAKTAIL